MNTTDGAGDDSSSNALGGATSDNDVSQQQQHQQVTTYQVDKNKHPMSTEHANKNGYVKMGDNGVIAMFSKNRVPSLPKVDEEWLQKFMIHSMCPGVNFSCSRMRISRRVGAGIAI